MSIATANVLRKAKNLICDPDNWVQGIGHIGEKYCAGFAICASDADTKPAFDAFMRAISATSVVVWNDDAHRTHAEVMAAFDRAIATEEASP